MIFLILYTFIGSLIFFVKFKELTTSDVTLVQMLFFWPFYFLGIFSEPRTCQVKTRFSGSGRYNGRQYR